MIMKKLVNITFILLFAIACVGTVEEKNPSTTKGLAETRAPLRFEGIVSATAIADDKVDIFFYPADGDQSKLTYEITYDGLATPISVPAEVLTQDKGLLKYTVRNLEIGKRYSFGVEVKDATDTSSESNKVLTIDTFSFLTANYDGVTSATVLPGIDGKNSIFVNWVEATRTGLDSSADERDDDPIEYEITIIDSNQVNIDDFDNESFVFPNRRVITTAADKSQLQVNGLTPGVTYNIRVRCVHRGFINNSAITGEVVEQNSNYVSLTTLSDAAGSIVLDSDSLSITPADGASGRTTFQMTWSPVAGPVDHFRTYYRKTSEITSGWSVYKGIGRSSSCNNAADADNFFCLRSEGIKTDIFVTDLEVNTDYEIYHLACNTIQCFEGEYQIFQSTEGQTYRTEATPAEFNGIISFSGPKHYLGLDKAYVEISPPDLSTGTMDGLMITVQLLNFDGSLAEENILNHPINGNDSSSMSYDTFNFSEDTTLVLTGMNTTTLQNHCIKLTPYIDRGSGVYEYVTDLESSKCGSIKLQVPIETDFSGLDLLLSQYLSGSDRLTLSWVAPSSGVFDKYRIFILYNGVSHPSGFNFADAISGNSDYYMFEVSSEQISFALTPIPTGNYQVGVVPYLSVTGEYQQGYNSSILVFSR